MTTLRAPIPALRRAPRRSLPPAALHAGAAVGASALAGLVLGAAGWQSAIALLLFALVLGLALLRPRAFIIVLLAVRPLLDSYGEHRLGGVSGANPGGAIAIVGIGALAVIATTRRRLLIPSPAAWMALLVAASGFSMAWAYYQLGNAKFTPASEFIRVASMVCVYVLAANLFTRERDVRLIWTIVGLSAVWPAIDGILEWVHGVAPTAGTSLGRPTSTFVNPNTFGAYLAVCGLVLMSAPLRLPRWLRLVSLALILVALVGTYSREGWVLFLIGAVMLEWRRRPALVIALALACVAVTFSVPSVRDRVLPHQPTRQEAKRGVGDGAYDSFNWRLTTWRILLKKWEQSPVAGYGLRSTEIINPRRMGNSPYGEGYGAHNAGVKILVEGGIILMTAWIAVFAALIASAARAGRAQWELRRYGAVMLALWVGIVIVGLGTDDPTASTSMMYALLALAGSLAGAWRVSGKKGLRAPAR